MTYERTEFFWYHGEPIDIQRASIDVKGGTDPLSKLEFVEINLLKNELYKKSHEV